MNKKLITMGVTGALAVSLLTPSMANAAPATAAAAQPVAQQSRPIIIKTFWSAILRLFITISGHASKRMAERNISTATIQRILNEGQVISRHQGVTSVRSGNITVRVNSNTGNVITVIKASGGGGVGGR